MMCRLLAGIENPPDQENFLLDRGPQTTTAYDRRTIRRHSETLDARFDPRNDSFH